MALHVHPVPTKAACLILLVGLSGRGAAGLKIAQGALSSSLALSTRFGQLRQAVTQQKPFTLEGATKADCGTFPGLCEPPFNCDKERAPKAQTTSDDGHIDWSRWCPTPWAEAGLACQRGNLTEYATIMQKTQHQFTVGPMNVGKHIQAIDAHYCFSFGHCDNQEVTESTTLAEAEEMCDRKFDPGHWRALTKLHIKVTDAKMGFHGPHLSKDAENNFAELACSMGNYHCDVMYCQQAYCNRPELIKRYKNVKPKDPSARIIMTDLPAKTDLHAKRDKKQKLRKVVSRDNYCGFIARWNRGKDKFLVMSKEACEADCAGLKSDYYSWLEGTVHDGANCMCASPGLSRTEILEKNTVISDKPCGRAQNNAAQAGWCTYVMPKERL